jgi:hypothetical protein
MKLALGVMVVIISTGTRYVVDSNFCHLLKMITKCCEAHYNYLYIANRWGPQGLK